VIETQAAKELAAKRSENTRTERLMHWFVGVPLAVLFTALPIAMIVWGYRSDDHDSGILVIGGLLCLFMILPVCSLLVFDDKKRHAPTGGYALVGVLTLFAVFAGYKAVTGYTEQTAREAALLACPAYIEQRCANDDEYGIKKCIGFLSQFDDEDYSMCPGLGPDGLPVSTQTARFSVETS
jgi:heme/copper-type cytochrome/quinol oxidase subunit 4